ncbi:flavin reductase [Acidianus sp. DSM 29099]|nr:flavin reductase [Acidianus sp. RZ1]
MRTLPLGIVIVTTFWNNLPIGMTVNTFNSVSLNPPLILFLADVTKGNEKPYEESGMFVVNFIDDVEIARIFSSEDVHQRFSKVKYILGNCGPILSKAYAYIEAKVKDIVSEGDHKIIVGEVKKINVTNYSASLIYYDKMFWRLQELFSAKSSFRDHE